MKAVLYRRVSSVRQSVKGESLKDQDRCLREYCKARKWQIIGNFEDAISGRSESFAKREGLKAAVALCIEHKATLVVYDLTRFSRSTVDGCRVLRTLQDNGAGLVVYKLGVDTTGPMGKFVATLFLALGEYQSDQISDYVKRAGRAKQKRLGYRTQGAQPYGYALEGEKRVPVPDEQAVLSEMRKLSRAGKSYVSIAATLNEAGHTTRGGSAWHMGSVYRVLNRKVKV